MDITEKIANTQTINLSKNYPELYQSQTQFKKTKTTEFFKYLYSYPPQVTIKWNSLDELSQDSFITDDKEAIALNFPFINFMENAFFNSQTQKATVKNYTLREFVDNFQNKLSTTKFYNEATKSIQDSLRSIPVFVILNGYNEITLSKPINGARLHVDKNPVHELLSSFNSTKDSFVESYPRQGFFFFNRNDAEQYLAEILKTDPEDSELLGLSVHCIGLNSAYKIIREAPTDVDFRYVPDFNEVKTLLKEKVNSGRLVFEKGQQQLRVRSRRVNRLPILSKLGYWLFPQYSFIQNNEYFKGTPIYIVQIKESNTRQITQTYFKTLNIIDESIGRIFNQFSTILGYGNQWLMRGSMLDEKNISTNIIFFNYNQAENFVKQNQDKVQRYQGSRILNLDNIVRKPEIYVSNLEDFLEQLEENVQLTSEKQENKILKDATKTFFVPHLGLEDDQTQPIKSNIFEMATQSLNLRYKIFKRYVGFLFSAGYN